MKPEHATPSTLREALAGIDAEIRAYPTPIPRCDAQFNHLLEERERLRALLEEAAAREAP